LSYIERLIYRGISLIYRDISLIYRDICGDISPIYRDICGDISPIYRDIYRFIYRLTDRDIAALTILAGCLWVWFKDHPQYRTQFLPRGGWIAAFLAGLRHAPVACAPLLHQAQLPQHARHMSLRRVSLVWRLVMVMRSAIIWWEGRTLWGGQSGSHDPKDLFCQQQRIRRRCLLRPEIQVIAHHNTVIGGLGEV